MGPLSRPSFPVSSLPSTIQINANVTQKYSKHFQIIFLKRMIRYTLISVHFLFLCHTSLILFCLVWDFCVCVLRVCVCVPQACTYQRMFRGTYPATLFINHYDTVDDINRRRYRIKMKVKGKSHMETLTNIYSSLLRLLLSRLS